MREGKTIVKKRKKGSKNRRNYIEDKVERIEDQLI